MVLEHFLIAANDLMTAHDDCTTTWCAFCTLHSKPHVLHFYISLHFFVRLQLHTLSLFDQFGECHLTHFADFWIWRPYEDTITHFKSSTYPIQLIQQMKWKQNEKLNLLLEERLIGQVCWPSTTNKEYAANTVGLLKKGTTLQSKPATHSITKTCILQHSIAFTITSRRPGHHRQDQNNIIQTSLAYS